MYANHTSSSNVSSAPAIVPCAVLAASTELALAIEHRPGRMPVRLLDGDDEIGWDCADGLREQLHLAGPHAKAERDALRFEILGSGLLVMEVRDLAGASDDNPLESWILGGSA